MAGLPEGFTIDEAPQSGLPEGFTIDNSAPAGGGRWADAARSAWETTAPAISAIGRAVPGPVGAAAAAVRNFDPSLAREAISNVPRSAVEFGRNTIEPFLHPIETIQNIGDVGHGLAQKIGVAPGGGTEDIAKADAVGKFFADRYGGTENIRRTLATDPVGMAGDLSLVLTGGGAAAARAPGVIGEIGNAARAVGSAIDPLRAAGAAARGAGHAGSELLGVTTGAGGQPLRTAVSAGYEGGPAAQAFREHISGAAPMTDVVDDARAAVSQLRQERGNLYRQGMARIGADKTILSWNDVDTALNDMSQVATYKGQSLSPSTMKTREAIFQAVDDWKNLRASEYWTPEGFDALKRKVGDIRDATEYGTPERRVADQAYNALKKTIVDQAPEYARVMKGYEEASALISDIERTLTGKPGTNIDTALRKLQKTLRNNVHTGYGRHVELANYLVNAGAPHLLEKLAGQSLNALAPRGLARIVGPVVGTGAAVSGGASIPAMAPALTAASPRLMGEAAYGIGRAARAATPLGVVPRASRFVGQINHNQ